MKDFSVLAGEVGLPVPCRVSSVVADSLLPGEYHHFFERAAKAYHAIGEAEVFCFPFSILVKCVVGDGLTISLAWEEV